MDKIKVLYVVSTLRNSGPTNQLLGKISNLDRNKFEFTILRLSPNPENNREKDFLASDINVDTLDLSRVQFQLKGKRQLKRYIDKYKPDIVHTTGVRADNMVSKLKLKDTKHCMTIRNYVYDDYPAKYGKVLGYLLARNHIKAMHNCDFPIACSKSLQQKYGKHLSNDIYVVQNGVDTDKYRPIQSYEDKLGLRKELNIPNNKIVFIVVGSLIERKDPLTIINAFKQANTDSKAILIVLGEGDLLEKCQKIADHSILFKGNVNNVNDYLNIADIYISASKSEGLPNSVLEAGSSGLEMILSNIPEHREIFEKNNNLTSIFNLGDREGLANIINEKIIDYQNNKIKFNNESISNHIADNFSNKVMSSKYSDIYKEIMLK